MIKVIYLKYNYGKKDYAGKEAYAFADVDNLSTKSLVELVDKIKEENNCDWVFVKEIKILGDKTAR